MKVADSDLATVDPLTNKLLSQKSTSSTWEVTYSRDLINARRVLRVMVCFMFTVCNSILCSVGMSRETEAETASDKHKDNENSQSHSSSKPRVWKCFPKKRGKKNTPSPIT